MPSIDSPCVNICVIDPVSGLCLGCGRTLTEIANWLTMSADERRHIMHELPKRRDASGKVDTADARSARRAFP
jgi:predicted Fe-S protein YdhL (DUF1289 family)